MQEKNACEAKFFQFAHRTFVRLERRLVTSLRSGVAARDAGRLMLDCSLLLPSDFAFHS